MNLEDVYRYSRLLGKNIVDAGVIRREQYITKLVASNRDNVVIFRLEELEDVVVYSNMLSSRKDMQRILGAGSLEEAYSKLNYALSSPSNLVYVDFYEHYEDADKSISKLPFIKFYKEDGGYYLTSSVYIACYQSICNASYHRTMYISSSKATLRIVPRHLHYIITRFFEDGKDAPVALVLGLDPVQEIAAALSPPLGVFEVEVGATLGGEKRAVRTPLYGIPVPANASIIVEGTISRTERALEGPFTDILMLLDPAREQPVFNVDAVYYSRRKPPAVHAIVPGLWEHQLLMGFPREALMYVEAKRKVPCVEGVRLTEGGATWLHAVISVNEYCSKGDAKLAALVAITAHPSVKHVVVVDSDINIDDQLMVEWAIATRTKASEDIIVLKDIRGSTLDPRSADGVGDKLIILAIKPRDEKSEKYKRVEA
ncbi:MAG: UbiD family decarboxylase [Desulfurococcaceae archaeon]